VTARRDNIIGLPGLGAPNDSPIHPLTA
jgi:hypothetical protein